MTNKFCWQARDVLIIEMLKIRIKEKEFKDIPARMRKGWIFKYN